MMIEKIILDYLNEALETCQAYMERPKDKPDRFVLVEITGQRKVENIYYTTVAIQSYAESLYYAAELDDAIGVIMDSITALDEIASVELNSSYNFTDGSTGEYRYQSVFSLVHY